MTPTTSDNQAILLAPDLLRQAEQRAAQMNVSRDRLVEIALTNYLAVSPPPDDAETEDTRYLRAVRSKQARALARSEELQVKPICHAMQQQGDLFWINLGEPIGSEPEYLRPYIVVQNDVMNRTRINSVSQEVI